VEPIRRLSYLIPSGVIAAVGYFTSVSWWALALLCGGVLFAWDRLWGDFRLLDGRYGIAMIAAGLVCLAVSYYLATGLNVSLAEFQTLGGHLSRRARWLYRLPAMGVGVTIYGLLIWSRALPPKDF